MVLVLPRPTEAAAMRDDTGEFAVDDSDGYDIKKYQIERALDGLGVAEVPIHFFNSMYDDHNEARGFLLSRIEGMRQHQCERIVDLGKTIERLIANREKEETQAVFDSAMRRILVWLKNNSELGDLTQNVQEELIKVIKDTHARSIWASTRRRGFWYNLDYYAQLGFGARMIAAKHIRQRMQTLKPVLQNLSDDEQFGPAHDFLRELDGRIDREVGELLQRIQVAGQSIFQDDLSNDSDFWNTCENRWGGGSGYREDIARESNAWFQKDKAQEDRAAVLRLIAEGWQGLIGNVRELISQVSENPNIEKE